MTGTSILTQNVTTFIKNSANFENIFARGGRLWGFPQSFLFHLGCQNFLGLLLQQETCQDAQQRNDDADRPAQVPHAAGTEDYANKQGSKRHSHISCPAGKTCDDRQTFLVEDLRQPANKKSRVNYGILKVLYRSKTRYQNKTARNVGLKKDIK